MSLLSRLEKLESVHTTICVRHWFWLGSIPDRLDVSGTTFDRLPGEPDDVLVDRISREFPQAEITIFRWLDPGSKND
jgi:hypothetical protein